MTLLVAPLADVRGMHQPSCRRVVLVAAAPVAFPFESVIEQLVEVVRAVGGSRGREAGGAKGGRGHACEGVMRAGRYVRGGQCL